MLSELIRQLNQLPDERRRAGLRHPVGLVVVLSIMSVISGMSSYRAMGSFVRANKDELVARLGLVKSRLPSYSTIRRVLLHLPTEQLAQVLGHWNRAALASGELYNWVHIDGKAIKGTVDNYGDKNQDFVNLVSLFFQPAKLVVDSASFHNKKKSEIKVVEDLVKATDIKDVIFTADAMHAQKNA
jgi:hypothetical protein